MPRFSIVAAAVILATGLIQAAEFEPATLMVSASGLLEANVLKGEHYTIAESVTVDGYMNHYTVDSEFGQFTAVGDRALKKLLHEIDAIAELRKMTSFSTGTDAVIGVVADTGQSVVNLAIHPVQSVKGISAGVSRFFKRTSRTAKNVSSDVAEAVSETSSGDEGSGGDNAAKEEGEPGLTTQLASSFMGTSKAQRDLARELKVDPYSDNAILQADLNRVAQISGPVGRISKILIPIPSVVGIATDVSDMVWNLSPIDLLIQNEEKLKKLGYTNELIKTFFSNKVFSPTEQTAFVAALESLDKAKGREALLNIANSAESQIEGEFVVRSVLLAQLYHENIQPIIELMSVPSGLVPVAITESRDGLIFAPLDQLLWTEEVAAAMERLGKLIDDHGAIDQNLIWVGGRVSDMALARLSASGWVESTEDFQKLEAMIKE